MSAPIAVVGSINIDMVLRCVRLPQPGETVHGHGLQMLTGGKGANQAVAAARLGAAVRFVGCVGQDALGEQALQALQHEGIDTAHVSRVPGATGVAMIQVEASGQNCIVLDGGANARVSLEAVDAAASVIAGAAMLVCQLEVPLPAVQRAVRIAHEAGVPVLLNPAPAQALPDSLLREVDVLVPNESEAALIDEAPPVGGFAEMARRLRARGPSVVIVTLGEQGVLVADGQGERLLPAQRVEPVDTTGAGDAFVGAFAVARCEGAALGDAVAFAQRIASLSVTRPGAMSSLPTRREAVERGWWPAGQAR